MDFIDFSEIAKRESWRKEIYRPIYHIHKWWAQRLGTIFRAASIKAFDTLTLDSFYANHCYNKIVLDPFMGSGTTLGEGLKLGCNVIGCDINPVSSFLVEEELKNVDPRDLDAAYAKIENEVAETIRYFHHTINPDTQEKIPALYYFWVMMVATPSGEEVPLFKNYFVSHNAYPHKKPEAQILCPDCGNIFLGKYKQPEAACPECGFTFNPNEGTVTGAFVKDSAGKKHRIKDLIGKDSPPKEKPYGILAIAKDGEKRYLPFREYDLQLYNEASSELKKYSDYLPKLEIAPGHNADQALGYGFKYWGDLFNDREKLCLALLLKSIMKLDQDIRGQFICLFNSTLEFNNRFCSYKGEGTGAIRPIFSNHILKPEREPVENSVWGFAQSSGCFSSLYRTRLKKAKSYLDQPFEVEVGTDGRTSKRISSGSIRPAIVHSFPEEQLSGQFALILNGDSSDLPLPDCSVDAVITDPPFFDFINYSELSDFFYAWLQIAYPNRMMFSSTNSRRKGEVQNSDCTVFSSNLGKVFAECRRVLKRDGELIFSFHHSRKEGWEAISKAIAAAGFYVAAISPVYAELSASTPKAGAKEPISIDMMITCSQNRCSITDEQIKALASDYISKLRLNGFKLSSSDEFVVKSGCELLSNSQLLRVQNECASTDESSLSKTA